MAEEEADTQPPMAEEEPEQKPPMKISQMLKFVNIWMDDDLKRWTETYSGKLLAEVGLKPETQKVTELSMFHKDDYHHLKTLRTLCQIKQRNIDAGLLDKWYAKAKAKAEGDEAEIAEIEKDYQETLSGQAEKAAKYRWVFDCYEYQKSLHLKSLAEKAKTQAAANPDAAPPSQIEPQAAKRRGYHVTPSQPAGVRGDLQKRFSNKATASRLAALRKKLAA